MGTRSNIYVETRPGVYLGTYCHYDGYPAHMFPTLAAMDRDSLLSHILLAMARGGFRIINGIMTEYLDDTEAVVMTNPAEEDWGPDYVYIKCYDGSVKYRATPFPEWKTTYDESR